MPQKTWAVGEEVLAADFNTYIQNQTVPAFTNAAQRDSQWPSPPNGATCITVDTGTLWQRIASAWYQPYGVISYTERTTNAGPQGPEAVFMSSAAFTVAAGRRIRVEAGFRSVVHTVANGAGFLRLRQGTTTTGTLIMEQVVQTNTSLGGSGGIFGHTITAPGGALQVSMSLQGAGGNLTVETATNAPIWIEIRDMGV